MSEVCSKIRFVYYSSNNNTIEYASKELSKYLAQIGDYGYHEPIYENFSKNELDFRSDGIYLGLFEEFGIQSLGIEDAVLDDEIYINITEGKGIISGINPRSVLLAVYRMLFEAGCRWIRPGKSGENIPTLSLIKINVNIHEKPSYRHRGIDFGGAKNQKDVLELIRWMPKLGFNSVFFEGIDQWKGNFYNRSRHYEYKGNQLESPELLPKSVLKVQFEEAVAEIKKLGLLYHGAGHGFTSLPFGVEPSYIGEVDESISQYFAQVNGKRKLHRSAADTNFCMSNSKARDIVSDYIVDYSKKHPEIDFMHVWLADGIRNHCECDNCKNILPSDLYISLLNELDEKLTDNGLDTKIVFISYIDLIWRPEFEKINNPSRFTLTHAPFYRTYQKSFRDVKELPQLPKFERNKNSYPTKIGDNAAFIISWQEYFNRDSFMFEYHFWRAQYKDPGQFQIAKVVYDDIKNMSDMGVNGNISCQVIKNFLTAGLGIYVMGKTLWNDNIAFEDITREYFDAAYGPVWKKCLQYYREISKLYSYDSGKTLNEEDAPRFDAAIKYIENFRKTIHDNLKSTNDCISNSWKQLNIYSDILTLLALALESKALRNSLRTESIWYLLESYIVKHEDDLFDVFDDDAYLSSIKGYLLNN
jgi:hypothetical protein